MALQITFTDASDITYTASYHTANVNLFVPQNKILDIIIQPFKDLTTRIVDYSKYISFKQYTIRPITADFDTYFNDVTLKELNKNLISQIYVFLKTVDPQEFESNYPDFAFDYKNDSSDV